MATHNPKKSRSKCTDTLHYIYRGDGHEHKVKAVQHIGGNILSPDPILRDAFGRVGEINLESIQAELEDQAKLHRGKGELLYKHYVISLAAGEQLKKHEWLEMITDYMHALGYDEGTRWTAAQHNDTNCEHVHILACRVKSKLSGPLVSIHNDYEKGWATMRKYEKKFGLQVVENPDETFGADYKKEKVKGYGEKAIAMSFDEAAIIRARFKAMYQEDGKPKTMTQLVERLLNRDVYVKVSQKPDGSICGISYRAGVGGAWISGSKVKSTKFTWTALQKKEGIGYEPRRDDGALGLCDSVLEIEINFSKKLPEHTLRRIRMQQDYERGVLIFKYRRKLREEQVILLELIRTLILIILWLLGFKVSFDDVSCVISERPVTDYSPEDLYTREQLNKTALETIFYTFKNPSPEPESSPWLGDSHFR